MYVNKTTMNFNLNKISFHWNHFLYFIWNAVPHKNSPPRPGTVQLSFFTEYLIVIPWGRIHEQLGYVIKKLLRHFVEHNEP
jgi:hypothetical protein